MEPGRGYDRLAGIRAAITEQLASSKDSLQARDDLLESERQENELAQKIAKHKIDLEFFRHRFSGWLAEMRLSSSLGQEQQEHRHHLIADANVTIGGIHDKETD